MTAPIYKRQEMISVKNIATRWSIHISSVYRLIESGALPAFKFGGNLRVHISHLEEYELNSKV